MGSSFFKICRTLILSTFLVPTLGQAISSSISACGQTCINNELSLASSYGCSSSNITCLCENPNFGYGLRDCTNEACGEAEWSPVASYAVSVCSAAGVTSAGGGALATTGASSVTGALATSVSGTAASASTTRSTFQTSSSTASRSSSSSSTSTLPTSVSSSGLSTGAKAGIGVGVSVGVLAFLALIFLFRRFFHFSVSFKKKGAADAALANEKVDRVAIDALDKPELDGATGRHELEARERQAELEARGNEVWAGERQPAELDSTKLG